VSLPGDHSDVFARERQDQILSLVDERGRVRVAELAVGLGVSSVTIRKDLAILETQRKIVRAHGGAMSVPAGSSEGPFEIRTALQAEEKALIGAAAAAMVESGESIAIDASTTALYLAKALRHRGGLRQTTVITNGIRIANELAEVPGITVVMPGGSLRWEAMSLVGSLGAETFERFNVQKAFVGSVGFSLESGLSDATEEEAQVKRAMVAGAREVIAIVDHTKWERDSFATFCRTAQISVVLTDSAAPDGMVRELLARGIEVKALMVEGAAFLDGSPVGSKAQDGH